MLFPRCVVFAGEVPWIGSPPDAEKAERKADPWYTGEPARFYRDWNILKTEEDTFPCESGGIPHVHCMDIVIAEKPQRNVEEQERKWIKKHRMPYGIMEHSVLQ